MSRLLREFGNVSAAFNRIAFLHWLGHLLFDSFGLGACYDVLVVAS